MDRLDGAVPLLDRGKTASVVLTVVGLQAPGVLRAAVEFDRYDRFGGRRRGFLGEPRQTEKEKERNDNEDQHCGMPNE